MSSVGVAAEAINKPLKVGVSHRVFFQEKAADGSWTGVDADIIRAVFAEAKIPFEFVEAPWKRILHNIEFGIMDVAVSAANLAERRSYAHFTDTPFRLGHNVLFVAANKRDAFSNIRSLADFKTQNIRLGVLRGRSYSAEYEALLSEPDFASKLLIIDKANMLPQLVLRDRVDGYLDSEYEGLARLKNVDLSADTIEMNMKLMTNEEAMSYMMFSKRTVSKEIVARLDDALMTIRRNGVFEKIMQKNHIDTSQTQW